VVQGAAPAVALSVAAQWGQQLRMPIQAHQPVIVAVAAVAALDRWTAMADVDRAPAIVAVQIVDSDR